LCKLKAEILAVEMAKSRMRKKGDDGLFAVHGMVRASLERLWRRKNPPTLSEVLVDLLNGNKLTGKSKRRVARIIQLIRFQKGYKSQFNASMHLNDDSLADIYFNSYAECGFELSESLRNYKVIPQFDPAEFGPMLYFLSAKSNGGSPEEQTEIGAVMCTLQLAERDQIDNVRKCSCGKFFVAGRIDQSYCSVKCRVKTHQSSDEFKAKRRRADRERYRLHRDGKVKESGGRKHVTKKTR
jgi:hypothetical protein